MSDTNVDVVVASYSNDTGEVDMITVNGKEVDPEGCCDFCGDTWEQHKSESAESSDNLSEGLAYMVMKIITNREEAKAKGNEERETFSAFSLDCDSGEVQELDTDALATDKSKVNKVFNNIKSTADDIADNNNEVKVVNDTMWPKETEAQESVIRQNAVNAATSTESPADESMLNDIVEFHDKYIEKLRSLETTVMFLLALGAGGGIGIGIGTVIGFSFGILTSNTLMNLVFPL